VERNRWLSLCIACHEQHRGTLTTGEHIATANVPPKWPVATTDDRQGVHSLTQVGATRLGDTFMSRPLWTLKWWMYRICKSSGFRFSRFELQSDKQQQRWKQKHAMLMRKFTDGREQWAISSTR
jgi:hypothetical protein